MNKEFVRVEVVWIRNTDVPRFKKFIANFEGRRKLLYHPGEYYGITITAIGEHADGITLGVLDQLIMQHGIVQMFEKYCDQFVADAQARGLPPHMPVATIYLFEVAEDILDMTPFVKLVRRVPMPTDVLARVEGL